MADELYIPQVDYTSREFTAIRDDLIGLIPNFAPQWTSRDSSDFGIVLLELFSYFGDLVNYQIDRAANEAFIDTATQRDTVIKLANLLGYIPNSGSAATGDVTFTNSTSSDVTVAKGTQISTQGDSVNPAIIFTLDSAVTATANATTAGKVTQGLLVSAEPVGDSNGTANQVFQLKNSNIFIDSAMSISVGSLTYTRFNNLIDATSTDLAYVAATDGAGNTFIQFGDGVSGKIPPGGVNITADYRYTTTAPSLGNVSAGTLKTLGIATTVSVTNSKTFSGGADAESTDSIRTNASKALTTANRAVSLTDYANLAVKESGVSKAIALANSFASVSIYVVGEGGGALSSSLKTSVQNAFTNKTPPGTTVSVKDYTPVYPYLNVAVNVLPQYNSDNVISAVQSALKDLFSFDNVSFNDFITEGEIYSTCKSVDGVSWITVNDYEKLSKNPNSGSGIYTQTGTLSATCTASTTVLLASGTAGIFKGATIVSVSGDTAHAAVGKTVGVVSTDGLTLTLNTATTIASGAVLVVKGNNGLVAGSRDLSCAINEVPIYEPTYITVTADGGS